MSGVYLSKHQRQYTHTGSKYSLIVNVLCFDGGSSPGTLANQKTGSGMRGPIIWPGGGHVVLLLFVSWAAPAAQLISHSVPRKCISRTDLRAFLLS